MKTSLELLSLFGLTRFPSHWTTAKLGDLLADDRGISVGVMYPGADDSRGIPLIRAGDLAGNRINPTPSFRISQAKHIEYRRTALEGGELLLSLVGDIGQCAVVPMTLRGWNVARAIAVLRFADPSSANYVRLALLLPALQNIIRAWATTTVQATLNLKEIKQLPLPWPPVDERQRIVEVVDAFESKIELNHRMNETLEAIGSAIFQSWFLGPLVREQWRQGALSEVAQAVKDQVVPGEIAAKTPYIGLEHMPRRQIALDNWGRVADVGSSKFRFRRGDILFGKLRPYFHKVGVAPCDGVCSTDILVIRPNAQSLFGFVLGHVSSKELISYADAGSTGTKMPRTSWGELSRFEIAIPPSDLIERFNDIASPLAEGLIHNIHESHTLTNLRDALLPKLVSGEIRVKTERIVEAHA